MSGTFTSRHMLAVMIGGFGIVIAVNFWMAWLAVSTFSGVVVENSYVASQKFNHWLDESRVEHRLGWSAKLARDGAGRLTIDVRGAPLDALVAVDATHPLGQLPDLRIVVNPAGKGRYVSAAPLPAGRWRIRLMVSGGGKVWRSEDELR